MINEQNKLREEQNNNEHAWNKCVNNSQHLRILVNPQRTKNDRQNDPGAFHILLLPAYHQH